MILQVAYLMLSIGILFSSASFSILVDTCQLFEMTETESAEHGSEKESEKEEKVKEKEPKAYSESAFLLHADKASFDLNNQFYHRYNASVFREVLTPPPDVA